jgi:hypothetical protein
LFFEGSTGVHQVRYDFNTAVYNVLKGHNKEVKGHEQIREKHTFVPASHALENAAAVYAASTPRPSVGDLQATPKIPFQYPLYKQVRVSLCFFRIPLLTR